MKFSLQKPRAFTLIEMLVSTAVLLLLVALITQLFASATSVTTGEHKHMDADSQARAVLDRMTLDFSRIVKRPDVDYYFQKNTGNDQMAFYSEASGYFPSGVTGNTPKSSVSLVGYRINGKHQLERLGKSLVWNGVTSATDGAAGLSSSDSPMVFLPQTLLGTWPNIAGAGTDPDYQVIGEQVYRLEFHFLIKPYTDSAGVSQPSVLVDVPWDERQGHTTSNGLKDVSAIVVTMAVLDNRSRLLTTEDEFQNATGKLPDGTATATPSKLWQAQVQSGDLGLSKEASRRVRIYQRYFYLNPLL